MCWEVLFVLVIFFQYTTVFHSVGAFLKIRLLLLFVGYISKFCYLWDNNVGFSESIPEQLFQETEWYLRIKKKHNHVKILHCKIMILIQISRFDLLSPVFECINVWILFESILAISSQNGYQDFKFMKNWH